METVETRVGSAVDLGLEGRDDFLDFAAQFAQTRVDSRTADRLVGRFARGFEERIELRIERDGERAIDDVPCMTRSAQLYRSLPSRSRASPRHGIAGPWSRLGSAYSAPRCDSERCRWESPFPPKFDAGEEIGTEGPFSPIRRRTLSSRSQQMSQ